MLCSGNSELGEVKIKQDSFQGDSLSSLVFALALVSESKEKINHLLCMDDLKLYSRSEKGLDS